MVFSYFLKKKERKGDNDDVLFLIYINYLALSLCYQYKTFADDLKIYLITDRSNNSFMLPNIIKFWQDIDTVNYIAKL